MTDPANPLFNEALRLKSEMQQVKAAPTVTDLAAEARKLRSERDASALRQTAIEAQDSNPDTAARALTLGKQTGLPPAVVERNMPEVERKAEFDRLSRVAEDPAMSAFVTDPTNYRIARDDFDTLQAVSDLARSLPAGAAKGFGSVLAGAGTAIDVGARTIDRGVRGVFGDRVADAFWFENGPNPSTILEGGGSIFKDLGADIGVPKERQNIGTDIAEGVGQLAQQIALAIATGGTTSVAALFAQGADQQRERQDKAGAYGTVGGDAAIVAGGAVTALTEKYGIDFILRKVPDAVRNGIIRKITDVALSAGNEAAQEVVEGVLQNVIEFAFYNPDAEILQDFSREATAAGGAAAIVRSMVLAATGAGRRRTQGQQAAEQATKDAEALAQINTLAEQSKLRERSPEKFAEFVRGLVDGDRSVEIDSATAVELFQSEPDLTRFLPAEEAEQLMRDVAVARETGADVRMPLGAFVGAFSGHERFADLAENVRMQDDGMTAREAAEWSPEEIEREMSLIRDDVEAVVGQVDAAQQIFDDVLAQLKAAAVDDVAATKYAAIVSARVRTRAERLGVDPIELWVDQRPNIRREITGAKTFDGLNRTIDDMRSKVKISERSAYGPSMLESIAAQGGIVDTGGDLKSMGADKWHRRRPGRRPLIRQALKDAPLDMIGGEATNKNGLDLVALDMQQMGYIDKDVPPENVVEKFMELLSAELAGKPAYSEQFRNENLAGRIQATEQLQSFLDYAGLDVKTATDEQIREALDKYAAEQVTAGDGDGRTMEQGRAPQTETPEFKRWFGESKVVDAEGRPLVVYHGTRKDFEFFDPNMKGLNYDTDTAGFFFTNRPEEAEGYAYPGGSIMPVYLSIQNPLEIQAGSDDVAAFWYLNRGAYKNQARESGADGVIVRNDDGDSMYVAFNPEQIKSVNNRGTFDPNDARILNQPAWHGSPHLFDKFSLDKIGTGEGAQAYGWGLYFAGRKEIGEYYREKLTKDRDPRDLISSVVRQLHSDHDWSSGWNVRVDAVREGMRKFASLRQYADDIDISSAVQEMVNGYNRSDDSYGNDAMRAMQRLDKMLGEVTQGRLYKVEIPEDNEYLLWDAPLSEQPEGVRKALAAFGYKDRDFAAEERLTEKARQMGVPINELPEFAELERSMDASRPMREMTGKDMYLQLVEQPHLNPAFKLGMAGDKAASLALRDAGIPGLKYLDGGSRARGSGGYNYVLFDDSKVEIKEFEQATEQDGTGTTPRGSIQWRGASGRPIITLTEKADLSTFLHEMSHGWLEEMKADAQREDAPADIRADWQRIAAYLKIDPEIGEIPVEAHETFARTGEAYFMEGKAPSLDLASAFERFKSWLVRIYRTIKELNVPINDDIRGVFDRMLATDEEIAQVRAQYKFDGMFATAKDAGMTDAEFERYAGLAAQARMQAEQQVAKRLQREAERVNSAEYAEAREAIANEVEEQVKAEPVYQVIHYLQTGQMLDGTTPKRAGLKLNRKALKAEYGDKIVKALPRNVTDKTGAPPELVAVLFGYTSGDEMVQAMVAAQPMQAEIQRRVDERMRERFPDPRKDGTAHEAAIEAMHGDGQMRVLEAEFRALKKLGAGQVVEAAVRRKMAGKAAPSGSDLQSAAVDQGESDAVRMSPGADARSRAEVVTGRMALDATKRTAKAARADQAAARRIAVDSLRVDTKALEAAAERLVGSSKVSDLLNANRWRRAEKQAADDVAQAIAAREYGEAAWHQRRRIVNAYMVRRSAVVRAEVEKSIERFDKYQSKKPPKSIDPDYLDKARTVLSSYQFGPKMSDRRRTILALKAINDWKQKLDENEQAQLEIPQAVLDADEKTHYRDMTVGDFMAMRDTVENIVTVGRTKNRLLRAAKERDLNRAAALVGETIRANLKEKPGRDQIERGLFDKAGQFVSGFFASHRKIESLTREFDGFADMGPAWSALFKPLQDAQNEETRMSIEAATALKALFEKFPADARKTWRTRKVWFPELNQSLTKSTIMSLALNWGNEGNREAIRKAFKWKDDQVNAAFSRVMTRADWEFVQAAWDMIDGYWPALAALEKRVKGIEPEKVEAAQVDTPFGTFRGGYYPLKYDAARSERAYAHNVDKMASQLMSGFVAKASTRAGAANERVGSGGMPVRLELDVMFEHIGEVIHDVTHREAVLDVNRLVDHPDIKGAVLDTKGPQFHRAMKDHVRDIAAGDVPALNWLDQTINHLRAGVSISAMGLKLTTAMVQVTGFAQSIPRVGAGPLIKSISSFYGNPLAMREKVAFVFDRSVEMRTRSNNWDRDVRDQLRRLGPTAGVTADVKRSFFYLTSMMDMGVAVPTWIAAYEKGMAKHGGDEALAVQYADMIVRQTQSSGLQKDLAAIQRGGPTAKMFTAFYSYFSATYNLMVDEFKQLKQPRDFPRFAANMAMSTFVPAVLTELMMGKGPPDGEDDEEGWAKWAAASTLKFALSGFVGVRDVVNAIGTNFGYAGSSVGGAVEAAVSLGKNIAQGDADRGLAKAAFDTAGPLLHLPSRQAWITAEGLYLWAEGADISPFEMFVTRDPKKFR